MFSLIDIIEFVAAEKDARVTRPSHFRMPGGGSVRRLQLIKAFPEMIFCRLNFRFGRGASPGELAGANDSLTVIGTGVHQTNGEPGGLFMHKRIVHEEQRLERCRADRSFGDALVRVGAVE